MNMNLLETLERYYNEGWLIKQTHPELPLTIWNYSQTTQYEGKWDEVALMARGLVTDNETGEIVARPFKKFFNWEETRHTPTKDFEVYSKMDSSLGILFTYDKRWVFASRGSFTSEQALKGMELLGKYDLDLLSPGYTYLFEIIYPENRIVCRYDYEDVVMLGCIENAEGNEVDIHDEYYSTNFNVVKRYDGITDYTTLKGMIGDNEEGFVIRFSNGERIKIKGEEYLRLHRIMTGVSTTSIWEIMANGGNMEEILKDVPDEFYDKIKEVVRDIAVRFDNIRTDYIQYFTDIVFKIGREDRRGFAGEAGRYTHSSILFAMLDGKDINPIIWKIVKPEWRKL
jgi:T4 RnlA family RNA ligase